MSAEIKIGYAVITTTEYKELIEDNINKADCIKELNNINEKLQDYFFDRLINSESYHFENMKECTILDYHYQELYKCFLEIGIDDFKYIDLNIKSLKHKFDNKDKNVEE